MNISIATAAFYFLPFKETLEIIKKAGLEYIELDIYWSGGDNWEASQHLKNIKPKEVLKMVKESGLKISSLHDMGGVVYKDSDSFITPDTLEYLEYGLDDIPCVVFHAPHKKTKDIEWWKKYKKKAGEDLRALPSKSIICIENMVFFDGYQVALTDTKEMYSFAKENDIYINIDTTHYAEIRTDIVQAADILKDRVKCIHLSDFKDGRKHLYIGEGDLDFKDFFNNIDVDKLHAITLECNIPYEANGSNIAVQAIKQARSYLENIIY